MALSMRLFFCQLKLSNKYYHLVLDILCVNAFVTSITVREPCIAAQNIGHMR